MDTELVGAGVACLGLAAGHAFVGIRWVLPYLTEDRLEPLPLGPPVMTEGVVRVSWHIVTVFASALGSLLLLVASEPDSGLRVLVLRWAAATWMLAAVMALWVVRRHVR